MDYKSFDYWTRRFKANTAPLPMSEMKMILSLFIDKIEELTNEVESLRSSRTSKPAKKLGSRSDAEGDS